MSYLAVEDERRIYVEHHPGKRRTIVLIHGWGMSCRIWDTVLVGLQGRDYGVASFDQRGCGRSDKDFREASIAQSSEDVLRLVDQIEGKDVVLNGWSLGARSLWRLRIVSVSPVQASCLQQGRHPVSRHECG